MSIPFTIHLVIPENVLIRQVGDESVILDLNSETYFGLDAVGTRMWELLTSSPTIQDAFEALQLEYDIEVETLHQDIEDFIETLTQKKLIELR